MSMLYWLSALDLPKIPIGKWVEAIEKWLGGDAGPVFQGIKAFIGTIVNGLADGFNAVPPLLLIVLFTGLAYWIGRTRIAVFTLLGLYLVYNLGYWENTMETLALVLTASIISIVIGIPLGIACARSDKVQKVVTPVLDFMQTMPAFVYLLPAVAFFSLGVVPGVIWIGRCAGSSAIPAMYDRGRLSCSPCSPSPPWPCR